MRKMCKKILILLITFIGMISVGIVFYNHDISAASFNKTTLSQGDKVILGTDSSGNELVWDVNVDDQTYYTLSHKAGVSRYCSAKTNNYIYSGSTQWGTTITYCDFYTTVAGKDHSPAYVMANDFDDAFYTSNQGNDFEKNEIIDQSSTSNGALKRAFVPSPAQITAGGQLGFSNVGQFLGEISGELSIILSGPVYDDFWSDYVSGAIYYSGSGGRTMLTGPGGIQNFKKIHCMI